MYPTKYWLNTYQRYTSKWQVCHCHYHKQLCSQNLYSHYNLQNLHGDHENLILYLLPNELPAHPSHQSLTYHINIKCCENKELYKKEYKKYIRRNNNNTDSIETGRIVIAHLLPQSDLENCMYATPFQLMMIKFYRSYLIYKYSFTFLPFYTVIS